MKWLLLSVLVIIIDQCTKYMATVYLVLHDPVVIFPGLNLTLVHNAGAAFSFLSSAGGWQRWFFIILAGTVSILLVIWLSRLPRHQRWLSCAIALVLGGAVGNLWDRVAYGYVIDFIDVYYRYAHWPAFNMADSAISVGAVMLVIDAIWLNQEKQITGKDV